MNKYKIFGITSREVGGQPIEIFLTARDARETLDSFENEDLNDGTYVPDFYELIVEKDELTRYLFDADKKGVNLPCMGALADFVEPKRVLYWLQENKPSIVFNDFIHPSIEGAIVHGCIEIEDTIGKFITIAIIQIWDN